MEDKTWFLYSEAPETDYTIKIIQRYTFRGKVPVSVRVARRWRVYYVANGQPAANDLVYCGYFSNLIIQFLRDLPDGGPEDLHNHFRHSQFRVCVRI